MEWVWLGLATHSVAGYGLVWPWPELYMTSAAHFLRCLWAGLAMFRAGPGLGMA